MSANKSTFYIGVVEIYLDFMPSYGKCVNYIKEWVTSLCHREVKEVSFDIEYLAPDLLTSKDKNITANLMMNMWHHSYETFSKVGMFFPFETSSLFILSKNPIRVEKNSFHNFLPIQANVYLSLLGIMVLVSFLLVLTNNKIKGEVKVISSQTSELTNMAAIIIKQGEIKPSRSLSYKVLFGSWLVGAFLFSVMTQTYLNCEFANVQYIAMDSVADLADNMDIVEPMVQGDSYIETFLNTSLDPKALFLWRRLKEKDQLLDMNNLDKVLNRVFNAKQPAFFITKTVALLLGTDLLGLSETDTVHEGPPIFTANLGLVHSPDISPACKEQINRKLIKMQEMKFIECEEKELLYDFDQHMFRPALEQDAESVLSFGEAKSTFALLIIGYVASITYFTVHLIFASRNANQKRSKARRQILRNNLRWVK